MNRKRKRLEVIIEELKAYNPEKIILFGSSARGEEDEHSDIDLVIIKKTRDRFL
jgi:predicted nucleotidyltransferase